MYMLKTSCLRPLVLLTLLRTLAILSGPVSFEPQFTGGVSNL